jgi:hypothetical protein
VTAVDSGTKLTIDHDGGSVNNNAGADSKVSITLAKVSNISLSPNPCSVVLAPSTARKS